MKATGTWLQSLKRMIQAPPIDPTKVLPRFGSVTQVSPLRVRLDGDDMALAYAPPSLSGNLSVADRVWCVTYGRQVVVVGALGSGAPTGPRLPILIGASANLNTLLVPDQDYYQASDVNAASGSNYPVPLAGYLEVRAPVAAGATLVWQRYTTYAHTALVGGEEIGPVTYVRAYSSGAWSPWIVMGGATRVAGVKSAKTYYEKYPDGRLICRGSHSFPANANTRQTYAWTYPVAFVGELPHVTHTADSTSPQNISTGFSNDTLTSITMEFYRTTGVATGVMFQAEGRWK